MASNSLILKDLIMRKYLFYILLLIPLGLVSCNKAVKEESPARTLSFTASIGEYQTKATDTAFERGDRIGLFSEDDNSITNLGLTASGSQLIPDTQVVISAQEGSPINFRAYYPYIPDFEGWDSFTVNSDQSTHELYTASDFMVAGGESYAGQDMEVTLYFHHVLSNLVIVPDCFESISELYVADVYGKYQASVYTDYASDGFGSKGIIKACKVSYKDLDAWAVIVPAQNVIPRLLIITTSGQQYEYDLSRSIRLDDGCRTVANVSIQKNSTTADVLTEILTKWTSDKDLAFQPREATYDGWIGTWTAHAADVWGDEYDYCIIISEYSREDNSFLVEGISPYLSLNYSPQPAVGYASEDFTTLTIPNQPTGYTMGGESLDYRNPDGDAIEIIWNGDSISFTTAFGTGTESGGWFDLYYDLPLTLIKLP